MATQSKQMNLFLDIHLEKVHGLDFFFSKDGLYRSSCYLFKFQQSNP